jgi:transcriptional regulator with XRE-family HTH domain
MEKRSRSRERRIQIEAGSDSEMHVGRRVRAVRDKRGLSLRALAERSGLSVNTISLIERGSNSPTVASLQLLAQALDCPITEFFRDTSDETTIHVRREERVRYRRGGVDVESLGAGLRDQQLEPFLVTVLAEQGNDDQDLITHDGQEFVYCVEGAIEYQIGAEVFRLEAGDSLLFEASQAHRFHNSAPTEAVVLFVFSECDGSRTGRHQHLGP